MEILFITIWLALSDSSAAISFSARFAGKMHIQDFLSQNKNPTVRVLLAVGF